MGNKKNIIKKILKSLISITLLVWLLRYLDFNQIRYTFRSGNYTYLFFYILFFLATVIIRGVKLFILIKDMKINFWAVIKLVLKSMFVNNILPTSIGGDAYKIYYLKTYKTSTWSEPFILIILERFSGLIVLGLAGLIYLILNFSKLLDKKLVREIRIDFNINYIFIVIFLLMVFVITYLFLSKGRGTGKIGNLFSKCKRTLLQLPGSAYLFLFFFSVFFHLFNITGFYFLIKFFNESILWLDLIFVLFLTTVISLLPISLGAFGVREAAITFGLSLYGISNTKAVSIAFTNRFVLLILSLFGWMLYVTEKKKSGFF